MSKCNCQGQDFSILYMMIFFILLNSCSSPSRSTIRSVVDQQCVSSSELRNELRRQK